MVKTPSQTFPYTVLLTRPEKDSISLGETIQKEGVRVISNPLLRITNVPISAPFQLPAAWILTSRYAVNALKDLEPDHTKLIFTVGQPTETICRNAGFINIIAGDGHAQSLLEIIEAYIPNSFGPIMHLSGDVVRYDLAKHLQTKGYDASRLVAYESQPILSFHEQTIDLLKAEEFTHMLFFSPRTAAIFSSLIKKHFLEKSLHRVCAIGMSHDVVAELKTLTWGRQIVTKDPQGALLENIGKE